MVRPNIRNSSLVTRGWPAWAVLTLILFPAGRLAPQSPPDLARERADFAHWLATASLSPYAAIALTPVGPGITLGPEAGDVPLSRFPTSRVTEERGGIVMVRGAERRSLPRQRAVALDGYQLLVTGSTGRANLAVFGPIRGAGPPQYYPIDARASHSVTLEPPERNGGFRTLGLDGAETEAREAGIVSLSIAGTPVRLRVYRLGAAEEEEAELQVFFRDETNGKGTYPAGRFVELIPLGGGRYRLDFNRARNPFCAYSTVFPCPAPWPGNSISRKLEVGEKYEK